MLVSVFNSIKNASLGAKKYIHFFMSLDRNKYHKHNADKIKEKESIQHF